MGRSIVQQNSFLQVLLKLIPSEVIAVFIFVQGVMPAKFWLQFIMAAVLTALTPSYLSLAAKVKSRRQLVLSTLSMVVWIYAMGTGPLRFVRPPYYEPWHGAVLLAVWTLLPPMLLTQKPDGPDGASSVRPSRSAPSLRAAPRKAGKVRSIPARRSINRR